MDNKTLYDRYLNDKDFDVFQSMSIAEMKEALTSEVDPITGESVFPGSEKYVKLATFVAKYDREYTQLTENIHCVLSDVSASTSGFSPSDRWAEEVEGIPEAIHKLKQVVIIPVFEKLGPQVIEASQSTEKLVDLIWRKNVDDEGFRQIVTGLTRWHVLDDLQKEIQTRDYSRFSFYHSSPKSNRGRRKENFFELADKKRLRDTLEALYHEKYGMTVADGWLVSKASTRDFLLSFMLSLFKEPLTELGGEMASFHRFFTKVCGYAFIKRARNLQIWFYGYQKFNLERGSRASNRPLNEPQNDYNTWKRRFHKYTSIEKMAAWMRNILPQYGIDIA